MKRIMLCALTALPLLGWAQKNNFTLKGKIGEESAPAKVYLYYKSAGKLIIDSATISGGTFLFSGVATEPLSARLVLDHKGVGLERIGKNEADILPLYIENGEISVAGKDSVKNAVISGSKLNNDYKKYKSLVSVPEKEMADVNAVYVAASDDKKKDSMFQSGLQAKFSKAEDEEKVIQKLYIKQNPDSYISLVALLDIAGDDIDVTEIEPIYKSLSESVRGTVAGQDLAKNVETARATSVGSIAPEFTQNDVNDKPVKLSDLRGKYILLDFWASWCGPCRQENPNVVRAYEQYKDKKFTVLGVSLDRPGKKDDWLAAIKADGLMWTQVSDLKFWDNKVAKQYGVKSIPQNYLIDPNGKIIGKNLRGDDLNKKLASLFINGK